MNENVSVKYIYGILSFIQVSNQHDAILENQRTAIKLESFIISQTEHGLY